MKDKQAEIQTIYDNLKASHRRMDMENKQAEIQAVHDDLIKELSYKLKLDKATVKRIIYQTCVTTTLRPVEIAHIVNEFHIHLKDITHPEEEEE